MPITLPDLPYPFDGLAPHMSSRTVEVHYSRHHQGYVDKINGLIDGTTLVDADLETIINDTANIDTLASVYNNAAQIWNHTFFWNCMKPSGGGAPAGNLAVAITSAFGSMDEFKDSFKSKATSHFGSGWAWLVMDNGHLKVTNTLNAEPPFVNGAVPLLACDVWEHAYYLDFLNDRSAFVETFLDNLVNWEFVGLRFEGAMVAMSYADA